jgi:hypothetical protein
MRRREFITFVGRRNLVDDASNARLRQGLISALLDDVVTFTCRLFETVSINDLDTASAIADEPFSLKPSGEHCNGRSSHPEHL